MNPDDDNIRSATDDEIERLVVRHLDGEITVVEQARLDQILAGSGDARSLLAEYLRIDALAAHAMKSALAPSAIREMEASVPTVIPFRRRLQPYVIAAASAVLTAAAVLTLSFLTASNPRDAAVSQRTPAARIPMASVNTDDPSYWLNYRNVSHQPRERFGDLYQDFIGIRGSDPNRIFLFEREAQSTRSIPVSGDF